MATLTTLMMVLFSWQELNRRNIHFLEDRHIHFFAILKGGGIGFITKRLSDLPGLLARDTTVARA